MASDLFGLGLAGRRVAIVLGAGATAAEAGTGVPVRNRPPLDKRFFSEMPGERRRGVDVRAIEDHLDQNFGIHLEGEYDSLEAVMSLLFTERRASTTSANLFRRLTLEFNTYVSETTNRLNPHARGLTYRMLLRFLERHVEPSALALISFNQDIQAEKALESLARTARWQNRGIFDFPFLYGFPARMSGVRMSPADEFTIAPSDTGGIRLFKLHGSLNWWTEFGRSEPTLDQMFRRDRTAVVMRNSILPPYRNLSRVLQPGSGGRQRKGTVYALPIVVPPVPQKTSLLPAFLDPVWDAAREKLANADVVVVFGYSCPRLDAESANLLRQSLVKGKCARLVIVNPDPNVAVRFAELMGRHAGCHLTYIPLAADLLACLDE